MRRLILYLLFASVYAASAQARATKPATLGDRISDRLGLPSGGATRAPAAEMLTIRSRTTPIIATPGETVQLDVIVRIANGWHINAQRPTLEFLIPTQIKLDVPAGVEAGDLKYPSPVKRIYPLSDVPLDLYDSVVVFQTVLKINASQTSRALSIRGRIDYQPCSDSTCLPPAYRDFQITIPMAHGKRRRT